MPFKTAIAGPCRDRAVSYMGQRMPYAHDHPRHAALYKRRDCRVIPIAVAGFQVDVRSATPCAAVGRPYGLQLRPLCALYIHSRYFIASVYCFCAGIGAQDAGAAPVPFEMSRQGRARPVTRGRNQSWDEAVSGLRREYYIQKAVPLCVQDG